MDCFKMGFY